MKVLRSSLMTAHLTWAALFFFGCASQQAAPLTSEQPGDFSTPRAAVETFLAALQARDLDLLSQCFSEKAPGEFDAIRNKTFPAEELDKEAMRWRGVQVINVEERPNDATVSVRSDSFEERIAVIKTADSWRILDF